MEKKARKLNVNVHIKSGDSIEGIWNQEKQTLTLKVLREGQTVSAEKIQLTRFYDRPKKPKYLSQQEFRKSANFTLDEAKHLNRYAQVWSIDTNKRELFGHTAHVSAVTACSHVGQDAYPVLAIIFGQTANNPELYGWRKFIELVTSAEGYDASGRYALVVDSEFSLISEFNNRNLPIHGTFFLPITWDLIYATSDAGKESMLNRMIAASDRASTDVLKLISTKESNVKHWYPIADEEQHYVTFLPLPITTQAGR